MATTCLFFKQKKHGKYGLNNKAVRFYLFILQFDEHTLCEMSF